MGPLGLLWSLCAYSPHWPHWPFGQLAVLIGPIGLIWPAGPIAPVGPIYTMGPAVWSIVEPFLDERANEFLFQNTRLGDLHIAPFGTQN